MQHIQTSVKLYAAALLLFLGAYFAPAQENVLPVRAEHESSAQIRIVPGKVFDQNGNPISDAKVREVIFSPDNPAGRLNAEAETGADGRFVFNAPETDLTQPVYWIASKPGLSPFAIRASAPYRQHHFVLVPGAALTGTVKDAAGKPIPGASVHPARFDLKVGETVYVSDLSKIPFLGTTTDASGRFTLENWPAGFNPGLQIAAEGFANRDFRSGTNLPGADLEIVLEKLVKLVKRVSARGTLRHEKTGAPAAGVEIRVRRVSSSSGNLSYAEQVRLGYDSGTNTTDARGAFQFENLQAGNYSIHFYSQSEWDGICVSTNNLQIPAEGTLELNLKWTDGFPVTGRILDAETRQPIPNVTNICSFLNNQKKAVTDSNGFFRTYALPGNFVIKQRSTRPYQSSYNTPRETGLLLAGAATNLGDILIPKIVVHEILVLDESGKPVSDAQIRAQQLGSMYSQMTTDVRGRAQIEEDLFNTPEPYPWYMVRSFDGTSGGLFFYARMQPTNVICTIRKLDSIAGELRTPEDARAAGISVHLQRKLKVPQRHAFSTSQYLRTDAQGRFKFDGLIPGFEHSISVTSEPDYEPFTLFNRVLNEAGTNIVLDPIKLVRRGSRTPQIVPELTVEQRQRELFNNLPRSELDVRILVVTNVIRHSMQNTIVKEDLLVLPIRIENHSGETIRAEIAHEWHAENSYYYDWRKRERPINDLFLTTKFMGEEGSRTSEICLVPESTNRTKKIVLPPGRSQNLNLRLNDRSSGISDFRLMQGLGTYWVKLTLAIKASGIAEYVESVPTEVEVRGQGWWSMNQEELALARARNDEQMQRVFGVTNASRYFDAIDQSYLRSGFLKAHPEIKYAYGSVIALGYNFHEEPRRERPTGKIYGAAFAGSEMLRTDTNGFIIEVEISKPIMPGTSNQSGTIPPENRGLFLIGLREWERNRGGPRFYECGTVLLDRDVAIRVIIRYNANTDRKLLEEAFAPIAAAFANEKQQPPPDFDLWREKQQPPPGR